MERLENTPENRDRVLAAAQYVLPEGVEPTVFYDEHGRWIVEFFSREKVYCKFQAIPVEIGIGETGIDLVNPR